VYGRPLPQPKTYGQAKERGEGGRKGRREGVTYLQHVQEFERLHLEAERAVDHQQHQIRRLGQIEHRAEIVGGALEEGDTLGLACDDGDRT